MKSVTIEPKVHYWDAVVGERSTLRYVEAAHHLESACINKENNLRARAIRPGRLIRPFYDLRRPLPRCLCVRIWTCWGRAADRPDELRGERNSTRSAPCCRSSCTEIRRCRNKRKKAQIAGSVNNDNNQADSFMRLIFIRFCRSAMRQNAFVVCNQGEKFGEIDLFLVTFNLIEQWSRK